MSQISYGFPQIPWTGPLDPPDPEDPPDPLDPRTPCRGPVPPSQDPLGPLDPLDPRSSWTSRPVVACAVGWTFRPADAGTTGPAGPCRECTVILGPSRRRAHRFRRLSATGPRQKREETEREKGRGKGSVCGHPPPPRPTPPPLPQHTQKCTLLGRSRDQGGIASSDPINPQCTCPDARERSADPKWTSFE